MKNYYEILGISASATADDIKRAYRALAKKYHPDVNGGDAAASAKFADVNEAYTVLGDEQARKVYDSRADDRAAKTAKRPDSVNRAQARYRAANGARSGAASDRSFSITVPAALGAQIQAVIRAQVAANLEAAQRAAFNGGRARGYAEARAAAKLETDRLSAAADVLASEKRKAKTELAEALRDRRALETELFNRDRELAQEKLRAKELEARISGDRAGAAPEYGAEAFYLARENKLLADLESAEAELAETRARLETALAEIEKLKRAAAFGAPSVENAGEKCAEILKAQARRSVGTLYGTLGLCAFSSRKQIENAYGRAAARYAADPALKGWFDGISAAYATLSDDGRRAAYDRSVGIDARQAAADGDFIARNAKAFEVYRNSRASVEFWEYFDELIALALCGDADSQNAVGELYYSGDEIDRDVDTAVFWFKEAVKKKNADAMYNLGVCYINGEGTDVNKAVGLSYIRQAAVRR